MDSVRMPAYLCAHDMSFVFMNSCTCNTILLHTYDLTSSVDQCTLETCSHFQSLHRTIVTLLHAGCSWAANHESRAWQFRYEAADIHRCYCKPFTSNVCSKDSVVPADYMVPDTPAIVQHVLTNMWVWCLHFTLPIMCNNSPYCPSLMRTCSI